MIFADKLIELRKRHGMSQEDLADRLNVTRQSISKWEGAQSVPDLQKVVQLSQLFEVSTDVLLKDDIPIDDSMNVERQSMCKKLSVADVENYIKHSKASALRSGIATGLFVLILAVVLIMFSQTVREALGETLAARLCAIFIIVCIVVGSLLLIKNSVKNKQFHYLQEHSFKLDVEAKERAKKYMAKFRIHLKIYIALGFLFLGLAAIPFMPLQLFNKENEMLAYLMISLVVVSSCLWVYGGSRWSAFKKLFAQGESLTSGKRTSMVIERTTAIYWPIILAIYLIWSLATLNWTKTWLVWPIASLLFSIVLGIVDSTTDKFDSAE